MHLLHGRRRSSAPAPRETKHIFFEFTAKETSAQVRAMFRVFEGQVQADAKSVYDAIFRDPDPDDSDDDGCIRVEVGCWSHARRKYR